MGDTTKHMIHFLGASKSFGRLSLRAKVLWPMIISSCDDQGRLDAESDAVKWGVCQNVDEIPAEDVATLLQEMAAQGMLYLYGDGASYAQVINWWPHQPMSYARPSEYPPPDGWVDRIRYRSGEDWITENWDQPGGFMDGYPRDSEGIPKEYGDPSRQGKVIESKVNRSKKSAKRDPRLDHPAIMGYRELARLHVPIALRDDWIECAEEVGTEHLLDVVKEWIARGYKPNNVKGMMDVARDGWDYEAHSGRDDEPSDWAKRYAHRFGADSA